MIRPPRETEREHVTLGLYVLQMYAVGRGRERVRWFSAIGHGNVLSSASPSPTWIHCISDHKAVLECGKWHKVRYGRHGHGSNNTALVHTNASARTTTFFVV